MDTIQQRECCRLRAVKGAWYLADGLNIIAVPGIGHSLTSWLPAEATAVSAFSLSPTTAIDLNSHLLWSALVGLSIGLLVRGRGAWKWMAALPFLFAGLDHANNNALLSNVVLPYGVSSFLSAIDHVVGLLPLIALAIATFIDQRIIARVLASEPALRFPAEAQGPFGLITVATTRTGQPWSSLALWDFVLRCRTFAITKALRPQDATLATTQAQLVTARTYWHYQICERKARRLFGLSKVTSAIFVSIPAHNVRWLKYRRGNSHPL